VRFFRALLQCAFLFCVIAVLSGSAWGQNKASLRGTVTDQSGGVVPGAKVTLTNTGTGISHTTTTGSDGSYLFDLVQVGTYKLIVDKPGFSIFLQDGIVLELNQNGRQDVALKIGQETQTVEVAANVVQVDTTGAVLGKVENQRMINDLPLLDRDTLQLGLLQAGVFNPDPDDTSGNPFSVSGQRSESLTFLLDGANNTDFLGNNIVVSPNPDAVEEFKILTNNYDAQYGRTSGGIVNQITKSGTNDFHGDAFEFLRNTVLNARDYFLPPSVPKQAFQRNVFGGTFGGPIKKNKTFFFLAYQGGRTRAGDTSQLLTVLTPTERTGNFGDLCPTYDGSGNCTPAAINNGATQLINPYTGASIPFNDMRAAGLGPNGSLVNPVIQNYIAKYLPLPNIGTNGFIASPKQPTDDDQGIAHIDHNFGTKDTLSFVYLIDSNRTIYPLPQPISSPLGGANSTDYKNQIGTLTWNHVFSPTITNEFRFAANRTDTVQAVPSDTTSPSSLGFTNLNPDDPGGVSPPVFFTPNFDLGSSVQGPTTLADTTWEWADNFTWTRGKHELKFGADFTRLELNFHYDYYNNGGFDFGSYNSAFTGSFLADFVGGFWDNYYQNSQATYGIRTGSVGLYAQDIWKVNARLTLDYGLRWDYYVPQYDVHNEILGLFPGQQSTVFPNAPPGILYPGDPGTPNRALVYPDYNNFAPRFGFAWDMLGSGKLVMRGGFGIFYDIEDGALNLQFGGLPPFAGVANEYNSSGATGTSFAGTTGDPIADPFGTFGATNVFPFLPSSVGTFGVPAISYGYTTYPHFRTPYSENFNYGFQWQATKDTMVEAVYVGSLGRKLISTSETNYPIPSVEMAQLANFGFVNEDCARPMAACVGGSSPTDPNGSPTGVTQIYTNFSNGLSDSDQFQLTVDKRFSQGFALRAAYTWSKTIDLTSGFRSRSSTYTDPLDPRLDRGLADFDVPQRLVISGFWQLPLDRHIDNGFMKKVAGGWQFNGIATFQGGQPFTLYSNNDSSQQGNGLDRPDLIGPIQYLNPRSTTTSFDPSTASCLGGPATGNFWFNPNSYNCTSPYNPDGSLNPAGVPLFTFGTLGRNALRGPGIDNFDLSLTKGTHVTESKSLEFRAEFFNAFNHVQFLNPDNKGGSSTFGQISTDRGMRIIQFGLKFYF
jgi:Carboxypeptidase regulatory-like domain/TonB dependent receptor